MHGVFDLVARDEDIAINIGHGDFGNDEAVTVLMMNQAAANFVARSGFVLGKIIGRRGCGGRRGVSFLATKKKATVGKFLDEAAFFKAGEHLLEDVALVFFDLEGAGDFLDGYGVVSKLKKT